MPQMIRLSRRRLLRTALTLAGGALLPASGCGGDSPDILPEPSPTPTPSPVVLPQEYAFAYRFAEDERPGRIAVSDDGSVFLTRTVALEQVADVGVVGYTDKGNPATTQRTFVCRTPRVGVYTAAFFAVSPDGKEVFVAANQIEPAALLGRIAVLSVDGTLLRSITFEHPIAEEPNDLIVSRSGDLFRTNRWGVQRFTPTGSLKHTALASSAGVRPTVLPDESVWMATTDGFLSASVGGNLPVSKNTHVNMTGRRRPRRAVTRAQTCILTRRFRFSTRTDRFTTVHRTLTMPRQFVSLRRTEPNSRLYSYPRSPLAGISVSTISP